MTNSVVFSFNMSKNIEVYCKFCKWADLLAHTHL